MREEGRNGETKERRDSMQRLVLMQHPVAVVATLRKE